MSKNIGPFLYRKIDTGDVNSLTIEQLQFFLNIYPREEEINSLKKNIKDLGVQSFADALTQLECGKVEEFMLHLLIQRSDLKRKAEVLCFIIELSPSIKKLIERF